MDDQAQASRSTDQALATGLRGRDHACLRQVVEAHSGLVYGVAKKVLGADDLAEDVAQEVFLYLWERPETYDPARAGLRTWLAVLARNKAIDRVRHEARHQRDLPTEHLAKADIGTDLVTRHDLLRALGHLTPLQREALFLAYFQGMTYVEVASSLGVATGTVKTRIRDGLIALRSRLSELTLAS